ncbi:MAG TPA: hypothetical protein PK395_07175 [bacterium]|nr:hypothetical protein [bacterium]
MYHSYRAAELTDSHFSGVGADLAAINALAQMPLQLEDVYIRSMYLCSDQPCETDWSQFTPPALEQISRLVVGQSVIGGHDRRSLPLARFFKAAVVQKPGPGGEPSHWVQAWFYWLRKTSGATDLLLNIDGGIYREVSIAWRYRHWRCSICGKEDGVCGHRPGEQVEDSRCICLIDEVVDVLEGSLVYKGADEGAVVAGARSIAADMDDEAILCIWQDGNPLFDLFYRAELLSDVREATPEELAALQGSATHVWVDDLEQAVSCGCEPRHLLSLGGVLVTCHADSVASRMIGLPNFLVTSEETEVPALTIQRLE